MEKGTENTRVTLIGIIVGNISSAEWGYLIMKSR